MARILCGDIVSYGYKLAMVPFSNDTITRRIQEISEDILEQAIASVKRSGKFTLQLDETTDIGNDTQLIMFVRYLNTNDNMEQFLFCRPLAKNTTGEQIFKKVDLFFKKHQLKWSDCVCVCEDTMIGCKKSFISFVKKEKTFQLFTVFSTKKSSNERDTRRPCHSFQKSCICGQFYQISSLKHSFFSCSV